MKPFNLERALAGYPVVTRIGKRVTQVTMFNEVNDFALAAVVDNKLHTFKKDGKFNDINEKCIFDLFMSPIKNTYWVNIYKGTFTHLSVFAGNTYESYDRAKQEIDNRSNYIATISFEV